VGLYLPRRRRRPFVSNEPTAALRSSAGDVGGHVAGVLADLSCLLPVATLVPSSLPIERDVGITKMSAEQARGILPKVYLPKCLEG
jgi:hypothetical protein